MNTPLVNALLQLIHSLSPEDRAALEEKQFFDNAYPSNPEAINLALHTNSFDFLNEEPDLYTLEDGEPIG
ncbi:hypothetical protein J0895_08270 [Phormidium pseudopriestleyi FRX01]|uniref:Uncharacterized protein n=1 Tax=Phormidium pseudopriestleyi FRX01 TaxID=1759528 RepID=A0ABS3FQE5_9CYAN|nr:hypothetical protein [Phormidium pseudopriestleyi]MBO0349097.1 hypothetical protein [Phormidium pseudopriestleyi FRX01]